MCEITKGLIRENIMSTNVPNRRSRLERLTAFYKDLSDIYVKYVNNQQEKMRGQRGTLHKSCF